MSINIDTELAAKSTGKSWHGRIKNFQYFWYNNFCFLCCKIIKGDTDTSEGMTARLIPLGRNVLLF